jgi:acetyl esterase
MPAQLDADAARLLETWAAAAAGPLELQPVESLRNSGLINPSVTGEPPQLHQVVDAEVATADAPPVPIRIYEPSAGTDRRDTPVLVYAHGGGWTLLSIDAADVVCRHLAADTGCVVVSVGYRLAPEHPFPAAFDDTYAVVRWVAGGGLGWRPARLAVGGDSAGGNIAAGIALHARDTGEVHLDLQLLLYPATDVDLATPSNLELGPDPRFRLGDGPLRWFWTNYLGAGFADVRDQRAVPAAAATLTGVAPAIVVTPGFDPLKDDGRRYAARLRAAGVDVQLVEPETLPHGFAMMLGAVPAGRPVLRDITARVRRALRPLPPIAREFRTKPFGTHSADLQHVLHAMRSEPIAGKPFLFISRTNEEWVLGRYTADVPPVPVVDWSTRFHDLESAEWHIFKLRWLDMYGEELCDD